MQKCDRRIHSKRIIHLKGHKQNLFSKYQRRTIRPLLTDTLILMRKCICRQPLGTRYGSRRCLLHPGHLHPRPRDQQEEIWKQEIQQQRVVSRPPRGNRHTYPRLSSVVPRRCRGLFTIFFHSGLITVDTLSALWLIIDFRELERGLARGLF